jgi:hypothetical protein
MKSLIATLALLLATTAAHAGDHGTDVIGDTFCSDDSKPAVLMVLKRVEKEAPNHDLEALIGNIEANPKTAISEAQLHKAGLGDADVEEVMNALSVKE